MNKIINKTKSTPMLNAEKLAMLDALGINVPSCNKCCDACNGCKMKFIKNLDLEY